MKKILLAAIIFYAAKSFPQQNSIANFEADKTTGCNPLTVNFTNGSTNAVSYFWTFGDGNSSTLENPSHIYFNAGFYSVTLVAIASDGSADTLSLNNFITVDDRPTAAFSITNNNECENANPVMFVNNSLNSTNFIWDFGDGITSVQQNPSHVYTIAGTFSVALIAQNSFGCSDVKVLSQYVIISPKPSTAFSVDTTKFCSLNHIFSFTSADTNTSSFYWNFGDGNFSSQKNPAHTFVSAGKYSISLSVTNQNGCSSSSAKPNYITVSDEVEPLFAASNNIGCTPLSVSFTNNLSSLLDYYWNFGDGSFSSSKNPLHIYNDTGIFDVSLTVTDIYNCVFFYNIDGLVNTNDALNAAFITDFTNGCAPFTINFSDNSNNADSYLWDFGDGNFSTAKNPTHTFLQSGNYTITLKVNNAGNCESIVQKNNFIQVFGSKSEFTANDTSGCIPLSVNFSDSSENAALWFWNFGDGSNSTLKNPAHTYNAEGYFTVTLITKDSSGCSDTLVKNNFIHSFGPNINYNNTDTVHSCNAMNATFNGSSIGKNFWFWNFGDGNFSTIPNPSHTFENPGIYNVSLTTQTANGCTITLHNYNIIEIFEPNINFGFSVDSCYNATFSDSSENAISWLWNFGDGSTSSIQNPIHTYNYEGVYSIALIITTGNGCSYSTLKTNVLNITDCLGNGNSDDGGFGFSDSVGNNGNNTESNYYSVEGCAPFHVEFSNPFDSAVYWLWNFGDGNFSTSENPVHNYISNGIFTVTLIVQFSDGFYDTLTINNFIKINQVVADFSMQQNNFCNAGNILLSNLSVNATFYSWKFGDGNFSTLQHPSHDFLSPGNYLVNLTASDSFGCENIYIKNIYAGAPVPVFSFEQNVCINDSAQFSSNLNFYSSYLWDFGDGNFSTDENPVHIYDSAGNFIVSLTVFDSTGCSFTHILPDAVIVNNPIANFTISETTGCNTLLANFNNFSENSDSWLWNFGDGVTAQSLNPSHIYTNPGVYSVSLVAAKNGCASEKIILDAITVFESSANFSFTQNTLCMPITATFSDSSKNAISWLWNFGDGTTDTIQNPVHVFTVKPLQNFSLSIIDSNGCDASVSLPNIEVFSAEFSVSTTQGCDSLSVNFTDKSNNAISWFWNFGDGTPPQAEQNPNHFFSDSGSYNVTLVAEAQDGCKDTLTMTDFINVYRVIADFNSSSILSGCNPLLVNFIDNSINTTSWKWNFGDSAISMQKNPFHIYIFPSEYDVSLIVLNDFGCSDTIVKNQFVSVTGPVAKFSVSENKGCQSLQIQFSDSSLNANHLTWYFGDGDTSSIKNPFHIYESSGNFTVSLLAEDTSGCSSFYTFPQNIIVHPAPIAAFTISDSAGCEPLNVFFDAEIKNADSAYWNFGDENYSSSLSENHVFDSAGIYLPSLILSNNFGCTDSFFYPVVSVYAAPFADFIADINKGCSPLNINFINNSENLNNPDFFWNFGNENYSNEENPSAFYNDGGLFDVSLIVVNEFGCADSITKNNFILAYDKIAPEGSEVVVVTVSSNTSNLIVWKESRAADFEKYVLYRKNIHTGLFEQVAIFNDIEITSFSDENLNTLKNSYCYKLQTFDFCGNSKKVEELMEYCTINVTAKPDSATILVQWTPYIGCTVSNYEIYRLEKNKDEFIKIASVTSDMLTYDDTSWHCYAEYSYKIKALNLCGNPVSSLSDTSFARPDENIFTGQKVEIIRSTVIDNSSVLTEWKSPQLAPEKVVAYKIYRSDGNLKFEYLSTVTAAAHSYLDNTAEVSKQNYYYKIVPENSCKIQSQMSNNASSIFLEAERDDYDVKLKWTEYKHWESGVDEYLIEKLDENGNWQIIKTVKGNVREIQDSFVK